MQFCVGLLTWVGLGPTWWILGDPPATYPLKPPLVLYHSCGSASLFSRHPVYACLISSTFRALFWNLVVSVRNLSFVSLLFRAFLHLVMASSLVLWHSLPSLSLICHLFLIFHIRYAVSDTIILYSLLFLSFSLPSVVKAASPQPRTSPMLASSLVLSVSVHDVAHMNGSGYGKGKTRVIW